MEIPDYEEAVETVSTWLQTARQEFRLHWPAVLTGLIAVYILRFIWIGYNHRKRFKHLPGPPHSWFWGHLKIMADAQDEEPFGAHSHVYHLSISQKYNITGPFMYMDLWPLRPSMLIPLEPYVMQYVNAERCVDKHQFVDDFLQILSGPGNLVSAHGPTWKRWRMLLNPGFAPAHLMTLVGDIVDTCMVFGETLNMHAEHGDIVRMEGIATKLTVDVIGKVVLDMDLDSQRHDNELVDVFRDQVRLLPNVRFELSAFIPNPYTLYMRWYNKRKMNDYIGRALDDRFDVLKKASQSNGSTKQKRKRTVIDLALEGYYAEMNAKGQAIGSKLDPVFKTEATSQIEAFLFAGHDTTSSTIAYAYYLLSKQPAILQELRDEHDRVLGPVAQTPTNIKNNPRLINQLEYTLAVTKEVLRLYPPVSSTRMGNKDVFVTDQRSNTTYPSEGFMIWNSQFYIHRAPRIWGPTSSDFNPSRFLPSNSIPQHAYRPFEKGARNCIGQDLALLETRIILALTVRSFDFTPRLDAAALEILGNDGTIFAEDKRWREGVEKGGWEGDDAWQVMIATAKPREGMPMVVKARA